MINFENLPNTSTPLNATNMNKMQEFSYRGDVPANLNDARQFGIYHLAGSHTNLPTVAGDIYGILIVYQNTGGTWTPSETTSGSSWIWQEIRTTGGKIYTRYAVNLSSSWSQWKRIITDDELYYKAENTETINGIMASGCVTGSKQDLNFFVSLPKKLNNISSYSISSLRLVVRGISGYVDIFNTDVPQVVNKSGYSFSQLQKNAEGINVRIHKDEELTNVTNNTPVSVYIQELTITFS